MKNEIAMLKNTHLMEWLKQGYGHCQRGSKDWCEGYLNSAHDYILALEAAVADVPAHSENLRKSLENVAASLASRPPELRGPFESGATRFSRRESR